MKASNTKDVIRWKILTMDKPFGLSTLFVDLQKEGIRDRTLIVEVLDELIESGLVRQSDVIDDTIYCSSFAPASAGCA